MTNKRTQQKHEEDLKKLKAFRLMDDDFMTACFDGHPECVELILRIIIEKPDLIVVDMKVQYFIKNLQKRSVKLDVFATDSKGKKYNIEIQRDDKAHIIYVNGEYRGDNPLGHLMADFNCTESSKMYYNKLKERVAYFKETKEGVAIMCKAIEEMIAQEREEARLDLLLEQISKKIVKGKSLELIADELEETIEVILPLYEKVLAEQ